MSRLEIVIALILVLLAQTVLVSAQAQFPGASYTVKEAVVYRTCSLNSCVVMPESSWKGNPPVGVSEERIIAVVFEVTSQKPFPVRAYDPILHVGQATADNYYYKDSENKTLIFIFPERDKLEDDVPVYLQYEWGKSKETASRTELPNFRLSMIKSSK